MTTTPECRVRSRNTAPVHPDGRWVLYWMIANRRTRSNFALQRAVERARELRRPLVILEALRADPPWASVRHHRFVVDGMADNAKGLRRRPVLHYPFVEPAAGSGRGLIERLARDACVVVTDEWPCLFLPRMVDAVAARLSVRLESVDANGLLPLSATKKEFTTAFSFRAFLQRELPAALGEFPLDDPLTRVRLPRLEALPDDVVRRWPAVSPSVLERREELAVAGLDNTVAAVTERGGARAASERLTEFLDRGLPRYDESRNDVEVDPSSGLSPALHYGHIGAHEIVRALAERHGWSAEDVSERPLGGKREGWWRMSPAADAFLDQLVTWRELGFVFCHHRPDYDRYASLPQWSRRTLAAHSRDPRAPRYTRRQFEQAKTHDELWNAAQRQLIHRGRMHNYLRMLWGKKILEWSSSPQQALRVCVELNNRYALDGRDPNSYSGIFWVFGRFDRAWGPERPIFGTVRYLSSDSTRRKMRVRRYLERWLASPG